MKAIRFHPNVPAEIRAVNQREALSILKGIHRYADTGAGPVKHLSGEFAGLLRLRVGNHRVLFDETEGTITIHRVGDRRDAYRQTEEERCSMGTVKDEVRQLLDNLPDDATWEDIQYSIYVRERIERGRREADEGKLIDQVEIERRMERWLDK